MKLPGILAIDRPSDDLAVCELSADAGHPAFDGHFPGYPVLPGVVQLDWAVRLADRELATGCRAATDFQVKFRQLFQPGAPLTLTLRLDRAKGALHFEYRSDGAVVSSGRIRLAPSAGAAAP